MVRDGLAWVVTAGVLRAVVVAAGVDLAQAPLGHHHRPACNLDQSERQNEEIGT